MESFSALNGLRLSHLMKGIGLDSEKRTYKVLNCNKATTSIPLNLIEYGIVIKAYLHTSASFSRGISLKSGRGAISARSTGS